MKDNNNYVRLHTSHDKFEVFNLPHKSTEPIKISLRRLLDTQSKSYYNIALSIGISPTQIYRFLRGNIKFPNERHLTLLAKALEVKPEYFAEYRIHKIKNFLLENRSFIDNIIDKYIK